MLYTLQPDKSAASLTSLRLQTRAPQLVSGFFIKRPCKSVTKFLLRRYNQRDYRLWIDWQLPPQLSVRLQRLHFLQSVEMRSFCDCLSSAHGEQGSTKARDSARGVVLGGSQGDTTSRSGSCRPVLCGTCREGWGFSRIRGTGEVQQIVRGEVTPIDCGAE